jgi:arylsulfatase A-like enzyme
LILLLDDFGTDVISVYGEHASAPPTPTLDGLAAEGVLFRNAYTAPLCSPTRAALLTGRHARRTGLGEVILAGSSVQLPRSEIVLPEMLQEAQVLWSTAAVGKWHLAGGGSLDGEKHPMEQGFGAHRGSLWNLEQSSTVFLTGSYLDWEKNVDGTVSWVQTYATTDAVDEALGLAATMSEPWLLYVALNAPHEPMHIPPLSLLDMPLAEGATERQKYEAMIEAADAELGRLLVGLGDQRARTNIFVMGDNGTPGQVVVAPNLPDQAKLTTFEGGINVPLIVTGPSVTQVGVEVDALVHGVDLFPTIAELAGVDIATLVGRDGGPLVLDGQSLLPLMGSSEQMFSRDYVFAERLGPVGPPPWRTERVAVRDERFKYMELVTVGQDVVTSFFDLQDRFDDGPNLLDAGEPLDALQQEALDRLVVALAEFRMIPYDGPGVTAAAPSPSSLATTDTSGGSGGR